MRLKKKYPGVPQIPEPDNFVEIHFIHNRAAEKLPKIDLKIGCIGAENDMRMKIIRTNDKCDRCEGFLVFEVREEFRDDSNNNTRAGVWKCTLCDRATIGLVVRNLEIKAICEN